MNKKEKYFGVFLTMVILVIGFIFGRFESARTTIVTPRKSSINDRENDLDKKWRFINPLLDCGELENLSNKTINSMKQEVVDFIDEEKKQLKVSAVSVYFRDLNNGPWFGINEKEEFNPGSLLKVPLMMRILKDTEVDPSILQETILVKGQTDPLIQYYKPELNLVMGNSYTVAELLTLMIVYSNNDATKAIEQFIGKDWLYKSYEELGVKMPTEGNYAISTRAYGS
ncbi:MAG: serine hydrolase, partial [Patescibacteria group bacterium]